MVMTSELFEPVFSHSLAMSGEGHPMVCEVEIESAIAPNT